MRIDFRKLPDSVQWFFLGQFVVAEALRRNYRPCESKFLRPGEIVVFHIFKTVAMAPDVWALVKDVAH